MAFTHYKTEGIFLKEKDRGEADRLFTIFTKDFGKIEILGKAIRKIASKLRSGAGLFGLSDISFIQGKTYKILTDAVAIRRFEGIKKNSDKLESAYKMADALNCLTGWEEEDKAAWNLLEETFSFLNSSRIESKKTRAEAIYLYFLWRLLSVLGYSPELYHCPICGKKLLPETFFFVPREGGVVCWRCLKDIQKREDSGYGRLMLGEKEREKGKKDIGKALLKNQTIVPITIGAVKILRIFIKEKIFTLNRIVAEEEDWQALERTSELYLSFLKEELSKGKEK